MKNLTGVYTREERVNVYPAMAQRALQGMLYPATRDDIAGYAAFQGASDDLVDLLAALPDQEYGNAYEIRREVALLAEHGAI